MAKERMREQLTGLPTSEYLEAKAREGWRPLAIEWEREATGGGAASGWRQEVPFGLRVSPDCQHLEEHPREKESMKLMIALIVDDRSLSKVAEGLNQSGFRQRSGAPWTQVAVFNMLPRLIEAGPQILSMEEWFTTKARLLKAV